jgi:hypothetical protein
MYRHAGTALSQQRRWCVGAGAHRHIRVTRRVLRRCKQPPASTPMSRASGGASLKYSTETSHVCIRKSPPSHTGCSSDWKLVASHTKGHVSAQRSGASHGRCAQSACMLPTRLYAARGTSLRYMKHASPTTHAWRGKSSMSTMQAAAAAPRSHTYI